MEPAGARFSWAIPGSVLLGFLLAWLFIDLGNGAERAFAPITAVWIFGIPLMDTTRLMSNRWRQGRSAFEADQYHLHHAFMRAGFSVGQAWWGIVGLSLLCAAIGMGLELLGVPEYLRFYGFIAFGLLLPYAVMKARLATVDRSDSSPSPPPPNEAVERPSREGKNDPKTNSGHRRRRLPRLAPVRTPAGRRPRRALRGQLLHRHAKQHRAPAAATPISS